MAEAGVACNVHFKPLPLFSAYKALGFQIEDYPNSYKQYENEITLPLHTQLSDEDLAYILEGIKSALVGGAGQLQELGDSVMYRRYLKRVFDVAVALVALPFCIPIWIVIAAMIYLEDGGPVFCTSLRLGKGGRTFRM